MSKQNLKFEVVQVMCKLRYWTFERIKSHWFRYLHGCRNDQEGRSYVEVTFSMTTEKSFAQRRRHEVKFLKRVKNINKNGKEDEKEEKSNGG